MLYIFLNLRCLPRLGTGTITTFSSYELRIFQTLADHSAKRLNKSAFVIVFTLIESEGLLIAVTEQMKRFDINIRSFESAFQKRPEVFKAISMNLPARVALQVINDLSVVFIFQIIVSHEHIRA